MYVETVRNLVTHKDFGEFQLKQPAPEAPKLEESDVAKLKKVLDVVTDELLKQIDDKSTSNDRVLKLSNLMSIIAELIRSYPESGDRILASRHNYRQFLQSLLENIILDRRPNETVVAANSIFFSIMNANNSTECNETMVEIVQATLRNVLQSVASKTTELTKDEGKDFCQKATTLTKFMNLLKDCNPLVSLFSFVRE